MTDVRLAIYLDGMSKNIHGNAERQRVDHMIRTYLEASGTNVVAIPAASLDDPAIMDLHKKQITNALK